jgi:cardiolipin synthase
MLKTITRNIPNVLTILRILMIPILVASFYFEGKTANYISTGIFVFASITDYIDGLLARYWSVQTNFGRMLDPIADKMLVASTLLMLVDRHMAPVIPIVIILCREIFISGMREYLASIKKIIHVKFIGKLKTAIQMFAIVILLLGDEVLGSYAEVLGLVALWGAAVLTLVSGLSYFIEGIKHI